MALAFLNRCIFRATSSGTGAFVPASAITGYKMPGDCNDPAVVTNATYRYFAQSDDLSQYEVGYGVWNGTNLARTVILESSNSDAIVTFSAAPRVAMGGPLAQEILHDVVFDTGNISTPTAEIEFGVELSVYSDVQIITENLQIGTASTPPTRALLQVNIDSGDPITDFIEFNFENSYLADDGYFTGNARVQLEPDMYTMYRLFVSNDGAKEHSADTVSAFPMSDGGLTNFNLIAVDDSGSGSPVNFVAGRLYVIGRRRPILPA